MDVLTVLLLLIAAICFGLAMVGVAGGRINLIAAGLLAWVLVPLLAAIGA